ncbi:winged helix-turn-helix transcriptional regulator [Agrococcus sediminis]|uniref:Winged helix-turn-helix transcriptional regulator n=1 Tax=Agrococcus sediminis TaxID=2599924 RepID=A0A5M8QK96_9MICO|nr:winged helix-turn-helix domain-containing protein [Agrococcus sediminis]KAA6436469.1 winged helix-turn-helix transcriptional regulator [Agrococcus sediminis]
MTITAFPATARTRRPSLQQPRFSGTAALAPERAFVPAPAPRIRSAAPAAAPAAPAPVRAVPDGTEARGFVLYVGLGEDAAAADHIELARLVGELRALTSRLAPSAETHAAVALAPAGAGGRDVEVVRRALGDPAVQQPAVETEADPGIVIDLTRKRVAIGDDIAPLTYREFELLQHIVLREGSTVGRCDIIDALWDADADDRPNERTIDVHVRRLRAKLGGYAEIIRTVRGAGYRFDRHADVTVLASGPSPDRF